MAELVERTWVPAPGSWHARIYAAADERPYRAYVPDPIGDLPVTLTGTMAADIVDLETQLASLNRVVAGDANLASAPRALATIEAIGSSRLEHIHATVEDLAAHTALARAGRKAALEGGFPAAEVAANLDALELAVSEAPTRPAPFTIEHLLAPHRTLMAGSADHRSGGVVRTTQNWIGGPWSTPPTARYVPPPPDLVPGLLDQLVAFVSTDALPSVVQAAVSHAWFEAVHPFADGNGRVGRVYPHAVAAARGLGTVPAPVSVVLAARRDSYIDGLNEFRYEGPAAGTPAAESIAIWLQTWVSAWLQAAAEAHELCGQLTELVDQWRAEVKPRRGSTADRALTLLYGYPVFSVGDLCQLLGVSRQAATVAVGQLADSSVVRQRGEGQRYRWFEAPAALELLGTYARDPERRPPNS